MKNTYTVENLNTSERVARFVVSAIVIVGSMESSLAGTMMFAVINILTILLATTAIIGWDPAKYVSQQSKLMLENYHNHHGGHHV